MIPGYSLVELQVEVAKLYERVNTALAAQNVDHYKDVSVYRGAGEGGGAGCGMRM
jgi:hypothetical protein